MSLSPLQNKTRASIRRRFLRENSRKESDVMQREDGSEYIIVDVDNGNPGEDGYAISAIMIDVPKL